jgi:predicted O-linked N-acetylglucosamine transferase (SPINDLY family)
LGTTGAEYFDYIISDLHTIPEINRSYFTEKIIYLPTYQVNELNNNIKLLPISKEYYNIAEESVVLCCFNSNYKISPMIFDAWMKILKTLDNSVLIIIVNHEIAKKNILIEAKRRGVAKNKFIFINRTSLEQYLSLYQICDLFLDTWPYNAGTTATDSLSMNVPVLTYCGKTFSSRIGASILHSLGMSDLIANSIEEYILKAIEIGQNRTKLNLIKNKLLINTKSKNFFDTNYFTNKLEDAFRMVLNNYTSGNSPKDTFVK